MGRIAMIALALLVGGGILGGAWVYSQPDEWRVEHSATINTPAEPIFTQLNSLKNAPNWSSWNKQTLPTLENRHSGPDSGQGATEHWTLDGNSGSTTIMKSEANRYIEYKVVSSDGYFVATGYYQLTPSADSTEVRWVYEGNSNGNLILKLYMLAALPQIDEGNRWSLNNLKTLLENNAL